MADKVVVDMVGNLDMAQAEAEASSFFQDLAKLNKNAMGLFKGPDLNSAIRDVILQNTGDLVIPRSVTDRLQADRDRAERRNPAYAQAVYADALNKARMDVEKERRAVYNLFGRPGAGSDFEDEVTQIGAANRAADKGFLGAFRKNVLLGGLAWKPGEDAGHGVDAQFVRYIDGIRKSFHADLKGLAYRDYTPKEQWKFAGGDKPSLDKILSNKKYEAVMVANRDTEDPNKFHSIQQLMPETMRLLLASRAASEIKPGAGANLFSKNFMDDLLNPNVDVFAGKDYQKSLAKRLGALGKEQQDEIIKYAQGLQKSGSKAISTMEEAVSAIFENTKITEGHGLRFGMRLQMLDLKTPEQIQSFAQNTYLTLRSVDIGMAKKLKAMTEKAQNPAQYLAGLQQFNSQYGDKLNSSMKAYVNNLIQDFSLLDERLQELGHDHIKKIREMSPEDQLKALQALQKGRKGDEWKALGSDILTNAYLRNVSDAANRLPGIGSGLKRFTVEYANLAGRIVQDLVKNNDRFAAFVNAGKKAVPLIALGVGGVLANRLGLDFDGLKAGAGVAAGILPILGRAGGDAGDPKQMFNLVERLKRFYGMIRKRNEAISKEIPSLSGAGGLMGGPTGQLNGPPTQALVKSVQGVGSAITEWVEDATKDAQKARQQVQSITTNVIPDLGRSLTQDENEEQKRLYKQLARQYHPDMLRQKSAEEQAAGEEMFKRVNALKSLSNLGGLQGLRALAQASATAAQEITKETQSVRGLATAADKASSELTQAAVESQRVVKDATPNVPSAPRLTQQQQVSMDNIFRQMKYMAENMYKNGMPSKRKMAQQNAAELVEHMNNVKATGNYGFMRELAQAGKNYVPVMRKQQEAMARLTASTTEAASEIREGAIVPLKSMPVANIPNNQGTNALAPLRRRPGVPANMSDDSFIEGNWRYVDPVLALGAGGGGTGGGQPPIGGSGMPDPRRRFSGPWMDAINRVRAGLRSLWEGLKGQMPRALERLPEALTKFANVLQQVSQHLSRFRQNINQAFSRGIQFTQQFTSVAQSGLNRLGQTLDNVGKQFQSFGDRVRSGFQSASQSAATLYFLSSTMTQAGSRLASFGKSQLREASQSLQQYMSFEQAAIKAAVSSGDSVREVQDFVFGMQRGTYGAALDMFNAQEISQAAYYYSSAGVGENVFSAQKAQGTADALAPILQVAAATQTSVESMVKGVVQAAQQFGIDPAENPRAMGGIAKIFGYLANVSTMEVPDILESLKYVGPMANVLSGGAPGAGMDQVLMALLFGSRMGIKGSMLGRGIQQMMSSITDAAFGTTDTKARTAISAMGMTVTPGMSAQEQFRSTFFNEDKTLKGGFAGMLNTIFDSADGGGDMSAILTLLFPQNASRAGVAIGSAMMKEMEKMRTDTEFRDVLQSLALDPESAETSAKVTRFYEAMVAETSDSVTASVKRMQNAWFQFSSSVITAIKGPLKATLNTLANIIFHISDVISGNPIFATLLSGIIAVTAVAATLIGTLLTTGGTIFMIQRSFIMAGGAISLFFGILTTGIPALFAMAPALLVVGIAAAALVGYLQASGVELGSVFEKITGGFGGLATDETDTFFADLSLKLAKLTTQFVDAAEIVSKAFYQFVNAILFAREGVKTDFLEAGLQKMFGVGAGSGIMNWLTMLRDGLTETRTSANGFFTDLATKARSVKYVTDVIKGLAGGAVYGFSEDPAAASRNQSVKEFIGPEVIQNIDAMGEAFGIKNFSDDVLFAGDQVREGINYIIASLQMLRTALDIPLASIKKNLDDIFDRSAANSFLQLLTSIMQGIAVGFTAAVLGSALAVSALTGALARMNWEGSRVQTLIKNFTGLTVSVKQLGMAAGVVFGAGLFGRLAMSVTPVAKLTLGLAKMATVLGSLAMSAGGFALKLGLMAAQLVINIALMGAELALMTTGLVIRGAVAAFTALLSMAFATQAGAAGAATAATGASTAANVASLASNIATTVSLIGMSFAYSMSTGATLAQAAATAVANLASLSFALAIAVVIAALTIVVVLLYAVAAILLLVAGLILLGNVIVGRYGEAWQNFKDILSGVWLGIKLVVGALLAIAAPLIGMTQLISRMFGLGDAIKYMVAAAVVLMALPFIAFFGVIISIITPLVTMFMVMIGVIKFLIQVISPLVSALKDLFNFLTFGIFAGRSLGGVFKTVIGIFDAVGSAIGWVIDKIARLLSFVVWLVAKVLLLTVIYAVFTGLMVVLSPILFLFKGIIWVIKQIVSLFGKLVGAVRGPLGSAFNWLGNLLREIGDTFLGFIAFAIRGMAKFVGLFSGGMRDQMMKTADEIESRFDSKEEKKEDEAKAEAEKKESGGGGLLDRLNTDRLRKEATQFLDDHPEVSATLAAAGFDVETLTMNDEKLQRALTPQEIADVKKIAVDPKWSGFFDTALAERGLNFDEINDKTNLLKAQIKELERLKEIALAAGDFKTASGIQIQIDRANESLEETQASWSDIKGAQAEAEEELKKYEERLKSINEMLTGASGLPTWQDYAKSMYPGESPYAPSIGQVVLANEDKANEILKGSKYYWSSSGTWNADETYGGVNGRMNLDSSREMTLYDLFFGMDTGGFANAAAGTNIRRSLLNDKKLQEMASYYGFDINELAGAMPYYNAVPQITEAIKGEMLTDVSAPVRQQLDRVGVNNESLAQYFASMVGAGKEGNLVDFVMAEYGVAKDKAIEMLKQWGIDQDAVTTDMFDDLSGVIFDGYGQITGMSNDTMNGLAGRVKEGPLGKYIQMTKSEYDQLDAATKAFLAQQGVIISVVTEEQARLIRGGAAGLQEAVDEGLTIGLENVNGILQAYYIDPISGLKVSVPAPSLDEFRAALDPAKIFGALSGGSASVASGWVTDAAGNTTNNAAADSLVNTAVGNIYQQWLEKLGFTEEAEAAAIAQAQATGKKVRDAFFAGFNSAGVRNLYDQGGGTAVANSIIGQDLLATPDAPGLELTIDIVGSIPDGWEWLTSGLKSVTVSLFRGAMGMVGDAFGWIFNGTKDIFINLKEGAASAVGYLWNWLTDGSIIPTIDINFSGAFGWADDVPGWLKNIGLGAIAVATAPIWIPVALTLGVAKVGWKAVTSIAGAVTATYDTVSDFVGSLYSGIKEGIDIAASMTVTVGEIAMNILGKAGEVVESGLGVVTSVFGAIEGFFTDEDETTKNITVGFSLTANTGGVDIDQLSMFTSVVEGLLRTWQGIVGTDNSDGAAVAAIDLGLKVRVYEFDSDSTTALEDMKTKLEEIGASTPDSPKWFAALALTQSGQTDGKNTIWETLYVIWEGLTSVAKTWTVQLQFNDDNAFNELYLLLTALRELSSIGIGINAYMITQQNQGPYASGGIVDTPFQLVGELGPEVVSLPMGSRVFSASQTESIFAEAMKPQVNMLTMPMEMPRQITMETDRGTSTTSTESPIIVNFNGDMNIRDERDIQLLVDEIDRELGRRTQNAKRGMAGTQRSLSVD